MPPSILCTLMWGRDALAYEMCLAAPVSCLLEAPGPRGAHLGHSYLDSPEGGLWIRIHLLILNPMPCVLFYSAFTSSCWHRTLPVILKFS